jgi:uncharacterized protein (TIGR03435 family)
VALIPGTRLGAYEVVSAIGVGGISDVYTARDTTLNRDVALKILPDAFTPDGDRIAPLRTTFVLIVIAVALLNASLAGAPQTASPTFEVATVKVNRSGELRAHQVVVPRAGRLTLTNITIRELIQDAYGVPFAALLLNVPDWARTERVDVVAKAPSAAPVTVLQQMLQPLLAEYFKLSAHREMRDMDVFAMVLATPGRLGPRLVRNLDGCEESVGTPGGFARAPEGAPNASGTCGILPGGAGRIIARGLDMPGLAAFIGTVPGRMVIDRTGLVGRFDVDLTYTPSIFSSDAPDRRAPPPGVDPSGPPLLTALQDQLGLKLQPLRAPIEVVVIDHAEPLADASER